MRKYLSACVLLFTCYSLSYSQQVIQLYEGKPPGSESWTWSEKEMFSAMFNTQVVYNVSLPTLTAYLPTKSTATGTAVIIAPGGGFHTLSINSEGIDVAKWLAAKGVACFVLKYRLVHSETDDPVKELMGLMGNQKKFDSGNAVVVPLAMQDGLTAMKYVRSHAADYSIDPKRIGFMGFSAGGTVTMSVIYNCTQESQPDFIAPVYAYAPPSIGSKIPAEKTPAFLVVASDDQLGLTPMSVDIYQKWLAAKQPAEIHAYQRGGHGFGMKQQKIPTDSWIERFGDWLRMNGYLELQNKPDWMKNINSTQLEELKKKQEENFHSDWPNLNRFAEANKKLAAPKTGEKRVVFMGNSITEGWGNIDSAWFAGKPYVNRGISGQTTPQMLLRFRQDVIDLKPSVVVILAGTNDIAGNTGPATLEQIAGNIISMANLAAANKIKVVISSVLPVIDYPWKPGLEPAGKIVQLNSMLKKYAAEHGHIYLDYHKAMADEHNGLRAGLGDDGVHPNMAGYKIMEPLAEKAIAEALLKK